MLTIKLEDGTEHVAQFDTMTAVLPLLKPMLRDGEDLAAMNGEMLLPRIFQGLGNTDFVKDLAAGLLTLFPTLPPDRVWFNNSSRPVPYGVAGLEITELFLIIARCLESANAKGLDVATFTVMMNPKVETEPVGQEAIVVETEPAEPVAKKAIVAKRKKKR
jgi:hypothetical protein